MSKDGGAAFPVTVVHPSGQMPDVKYPGLSLRDYFAAAALQGMCAGITRFRKELDLVDIIIHRPIDISEISYVYADAMLAEREK